MARWNEAMAERERTPRPPAGVMLGHLITALADQRSRALPLLDAEGKELLLAEIRAALYGRYR